jgi:hypothetical protein
MLIYTEEILNPTTMHSSSSTFLPGSFDRQQGSFFRGTLVDDLLPAFPLPFFSLFKIKHSILC